MHPLIQYEVAKARHADHLRHAEARRLANIASAGRPSATTRIQERVGVLLLSLGSYLKERATREQNRMLTPVQESNI